MKLMDYLKSIELKNLIPTHDNGLIFYDHNLKFDIDYKHINNIEVINSWLNEVLIYEGVSGGDGFNEEP